MAEVVLGKQLDVRLPDQSILRLTPGPGGKGFAAILLIGERETHRGRPFSPERLKLRALMEHDHAKGGLRDAKHYTTWYVEHGDVKRPYASHVVKKELALLGINKSARKAARRKATGGRQPSRATHLLREQLKADRVGGKLRDAAHYIRWLVEKADIGIKKARPIVYRELRAMNS